MTFKVEREIGSETLSIETGKLARQAHGAALVRYGDTVLLGTALTGPPREGADFFPLQVDYRERMCAAGKFPGGFFKREGRPTQKEILTMRMIDRPIRPLFPKSYKDELQIQLFVLSADDQIDPDVIGMVAANAALCIAPTPFQGPVAGVRVGRVDGEFIINPTRSQMEYSDIDLVVAGTPAAVNMIEVGSRELSEKDIADAIKFGHKNGVVPICEMLAELKHHAGKECTWEEPEPKAALIEDIRKRVWDGLLEAKKIPGKQERYAAVGEVYEKTIADLCPEGAEGLDFTAGEVKSIIRDLEREVVRTRILNDGVRPDGRGLEDIRDISCEVGFLPRVHGSSVFQRGETQAMVTTTLGTASDEQIIDDLVEEYSKKFLLHYYFPPFSVGEVRRIGAPGRREIGHGALAERSLEAVLPAPDDFSYTIRLVSDILESNGSSSMATVCGGTLALMDAGVPIKAPVAGISIGLVEEGGKAVLFPDILGEEDAFGDMDFKVAGTRDGITGIQLDIKAEGLKFDLLEQALQIAKKARFHLLDIMEGVIAKPREEISQYAPRLLMIKINPEKIGKLIGPGGKSVRAIQANTGAQIDIEDDGTVFISCTDAAKAQAAYELVQRMTEDIQVGKIYTGKVASIKDFGAFIEIQEGQDGLCHISELDDAYVRSVADVVNIGDEVKVKVIAVDDQGRVKLSRKAAIQEEKGGSSEEEE